MFRLLLQKLLLINIAVFIFQYSCAQVFPSGIPGSSRIYLEATGLNSNFAAGKAWRLGVNNATMQCMGSPRVIYQSQDIEDIRNITFTFEAWEEDCGSFCIYNSGCGFGVDDDNHCEMTQTRSFVDITPATNTTFRMNYCTQYAYSVDYRFRYDPPVPTTPTIYLNGSPYNGTDRLCTNDSFVLKANSFVNDNIKSSITYTWYYNIDNETYDRVVPNPAYCGNSPGTICCGNDNICWQQNPGHTQDAPCCSLPPTTTRTETRWRVLGTTTAENDGSIVATVGQMVGGQNGSNHSINFTVKASANGRESYVPPTSASLLSGPTGPYASINNLAITPSCQNFSTGSVTINNISGGTSAKLYATTLNGEAGPLGSFTGNTVTINNMLPGNYSIQLANSGGAAPCPTEINDIVIGVVPDPSLPNVTISEISCPGGNDGRISFSAAGGMTDRDMTFSLTPAGGNFVRTSALAGYYENLPPGNYSLRASNPLPGNLTCGTPALTTNIIIPAVTPVSALPVSSSSPTCLSASNGTASIQVAGGSGRYHYRVYEGSQVIREVLISASATFQVNDLPPGTYSIYAADALRENCSFYQSPAFTLTDPTPLSLHASAKDVLCYGNSSGEILLTASGGSGLYTFSVTDINTGTSFTNTDGDFTGLPAGTYTAELVNQNTCADKVSLSVEVDEPPAITFQIDKQNIVCRDEDNGSLSATLSGGIGSYQYQWQFNDGSGWINYTLALGNTNAITNLFPAQYRLSVKDENGCVINSSVHELINPFKLETGTLTITPESCYGANDAGINFLALGGWEPLLYEISVDGGAHFNSYTSGINYQGGEYLLRVTDAEGCRIEEEVNIDLPPQFDANFLSASTVYEGDTLMLIEVSYPKPDSIEWILADVFQPINPGSDLPLIICDTPGEYEVTLVSYKSHCIKSTLKKITVLKATDRPSGGRIDLGLAGIEKIEVYPNPTRGVAQVKVTLAREQAIAVFVYSIQGYEHYRMAYEKSLTHDFMIDLASHADGVYVLRVASENDKKEVRLMLSK